MPTTRNDVLHRWRQQRPMRQLYRFGASGRLQRGDTRTLLPQARASQANPENDRGRKYDAAGPRGTFWVRSSRFPVMIEKNLCEGMFMRAMLTMSALCLAVGTADAQDNRAAPIFSSQIGRFQIVTNARDTFLFDSATGNVWLLTQYSDFNKDPLAWVPMFRLDKPSDTTPLLSEYGLKQKR